MAEILPITGTPNLNEMEQRLSRAFVARYGLDLGLEVTAETMAWGWENQQAVADAVNPLGLLFRVGQSRSRRFFRWRRDRVRFPAEVGVEPQADRGRAPWVEPGLADALAELDIEQRTAVVLVHCFQWTYREVAELLDVPLHTVRNRVNRGMAKLRASLGVAEDA